MVGEKKVLVVVLALDADPWRAIEEEGQRGTWARNGAEVPILWLHGVNRGPVRALVRGFSKALGLIHADSALTAFRRKAGAWAAGRKVSIEGRNIHTGVPETYLMTNSKTVAAFRHLLITQEFDYILRTNSSTYVNLERLKAFVQTLPENGYYGGAVWHSHGLEFITGSTILLSRDLVEYAARDPEWDFDLIDDMAIGRSMRRAGAAPQSVARADVLTPADLARLDASALASSFLVRCKGADDRSHDIAAMHRVHALYEQAAGNTGLQEA